MSWEETLANAIIIQAAKDYRKALRILQRDPQDVLAWDTKREVEEFFLSGWFEFLTDVDGEYLIRKLREDVGWQNRNYSSL